MLTKRICLGYEPNSDDETCWSSLNDVDNIDVSDIEAIFNEYV